MQGLTAEGILPSTLLKRSALFTRDARRVLQKVTKSWHNAHHCQSNASKSTNSIFDSSMLLDFYIKREKVFIGNFYQTDHHLMRNRIIGDLISLVNKWFLISLTNYLCIE